MKTIKLYKKFKKYEYGTPDVAEGLEGGLTGKQKFSQGVGYANAGLQVANMGMQMFGDQGNEFGVKDDGSAIAGGALSGAAQGASMGSMGGPIATAIGAGVGGIYGGIKAYQGNEEAKARQEEFESQQRQLSIKESQNKWQQTLASGFKPQGNEYATKYAKYGGLMKMGEGGKVNKLEGNLISKILLQRNKDKEFIDRAYYPEKYPDKVRNNPDGSKSTHLMEWGEDEKGQAFMYPSIFNEKNESLKVPNQYADYISSEGYKKETGMSEYKNGGNVQQLSKNIVEFKGNSHEMGGIKEPVVNGRVLEGAEVEGGETMQGNFIFSEELGFAQRHKPLAKMLGKLEKKTQSNPNDKINNSTIARVNSQINSLKKEQEETKEVLGIENDLEEMKNGGLYKKFSKAGLYTPPNDYTSDVFYPETPSWATDTPVYKGKRLATATKYVPRTTVVTPEGTVKNGFPKLSKLKSEGEIAQLPISNSPNNYLNPVANTTIKPSLEKENSQDLASLDNMQMVLPEGSTSGGATTKTSVNWGNVASGLTPYLGVAANYMLNEKAKKLKLPQEKLTTPISLQRVNYDNQRAEADIQRGQLNKITNRNLTNSAVASAVMAKNLGTTIRQKNAINEAEMNANRMISNEEATRNKTIEQYNNTTQVGNEDRFYNRDRDYLQNKGQIATNLSSMVQKQRADKMKYDLEDRKIDAVSDADAGRGVFGRTGEDDRKKAKKTHAWTSTEEDLTNKKYGGKVKSSLRKKVGC